MVIKVKHRYSVNHNQTQIPLGSSSSTRPIKLSLATGVLYLAFILLVQQYISDHWPVPHGKMILMFTYMNTCIPSLVIISFPIIIVLLLYYNAMMYDLPPSDLRRKFNQEMIHLASIPVIFFITGIFIFILGQGCYNLKIKLLIPVNPAEQELLPIILLVVTTITIFILIRVPSRKHKKETGYGIFYSREKTLMEIFFYTMASITTFTTIIVLAEAGIVGPYHIWIVFLSIVLASLIAKTVYRYVSMMEYEDLGDRPCEAIYTNAYEKLYRHVLSILSFLPSIYIILTLIPFVLLSNIYLVITASLTAFIAFATAIATHMFISNFKKLNMQLPTVIVYWKMLIKCLEKRSSETTNTHTLYTIHPSLILSDNRKRIT